MLAGAMVTTSLSAAMTAFAAEGDSEDYNNAINAAVDAAAASDVFDSLSSYSSVYDDAAGNMKTYVENFIKASVALNTQDATTYAKMANTTSKITADIKSGLAEESLGEEELAAKQAAVDKFKPNNYATIYVYPWYYGDTTAAADVTAQESYTRYQYGVTSLWPTTTALTENTTTSVSAVSDLIALRDQIAGGFLTKDVSSMDFETAVSTFTAAYDGYDGLLDVPAAWRLDLDSQMDAVKAQLEKAAGQAGTLAENEMNAFLEAHSADTITLENYTEEAAAYREVDSLIDQLPSSMSSYTDKYSSVRSSRSTYESAAKAAVVTLVGDEIVAITTAYGEDGSGVNESNYEEASARISAVTTVYNDGAFGTLTLQRYEGTYLRDWIAKLNPVSGAAEFISGGGQSWIDDVNALYNQYGADSFTVPVEEAVEVNTRLGELKATYDAMSDNVKGLANIAAAYTTYETMAAAVVEPYFQATLNEYQAAIDEMKADWFDGENVKAITMNDFVTVSAVLANLDSLYARFNDEQKNNEDVIAAYAAHAALQAAYDTALNSADSYVESEFTYPEGLNEENVAEAIDTLDTVLTNSELISILGLGTDSLAQFVTDNVYSDAAVTLVVKTVFPLLVDLLGDSASLASIVGINVTPRTVAQGLANYPEAKAAFEAAVDDWNAVDWNAVSWGVETGNADQFYAALGANMEGIQKVLAALLANSPMTGLVKIAGVDGYALTFVPLLTQLGCENIATVEEFKADTSATAMLRKIVEPLVNRVVEICGAPVEELTGLLPQVAYFLTADGLKQVLSPLVIDVSGFATLKVDLWETLSASVNLNDINALLSGLIADAVPGFSWVNIDFIYLAGLGSAETASDVAGNNYVKVTADNSKVAVALLEYVGKVLNANAQFIKDSIPAIADENLAGVVNGLLDTVLNAEPGKIATALIHFIAPQCETAVSPYNYPEIEQNKLVIPEGVVYGEDAYAQTPAALDALLKGFGLDLSSLVSGALYTDDLIAQVFGLYDTIRANATVAQVFDALGIDISEETITALKAEAGSVTDQASFVKALTTALSPFDDVLAMLFAGQDYSVFGYTVKGMDNYNTVVIPLLEVLGCTDVMSAKDYQAAVAEGASPLEAIVTQVLDRLNEILASPVDNLTKVLPNLAYFLDSNNLSVMLENVLAPLDTLLAHVDVDLTATLNSLLEAFGIPAIDDLDNDLAGLLNQVLGMIQVNGAPLALTLPAIDLHKLASYGTTETYTSAMVIDGKNVEAKRIVADQAAVTGAVIGYLYEVLSDEATMDLISGLLGDSGAMVEGILGGLLGNGEAGFTNALFELLGFTPAADDNNGGEGGNEGGNDNVNTGDTMLAVVAGAAVLAAGAVLVLSRKKKEN